MIRPAQVLSLVAAGLVLAGAGVWLVARHGADGVGEPATPVLPLSPADLNAVTRLEIFKGDGSRTTLTREATHWTVTQRGYPADTGQVRKLLLDLSNLKVEEQKTADPALYSKLGVEDPSGAQATGTGLTINVHGKALGLIVGKTSGTSSVYLRVTGQPQSLLANPQVAPDADPRHWLDRTFSMSHLTRLLKWKLPPRMARPTSSNDLRPAPHRNFSSAPYLRDGNLLTPPHRPRRRARSPPCSWMMSEKPARIPR